MLDNENKNGHDEEKILLGHAGVDSGQLLVVDPCYLENLDYDTVYNQACDTTCAPKKFGGEVGQLGVVSRTGFGDGNYPVYAIVRDCGAWGRRVVRLVVEFVDAEKAEGSED